MKTAPYKTQYPHIFSPMEIGRGKEKITFKNRILLSPMSDVGYGLDGHGIMTDEGFDFFEQFLHGGFASVALPIEIPPNSAHPRSLVIDNEETAAFQDMHKMARLAEAYRAHLVSEIYHPGCCMTPGPGREPIAASDMYWNGNFVRGMNYDDMDKVCDEYARAAFMAKRAGFSMIMLHVGHGWLLSNFLSPLTNHRTDEFGGSVENRCRFPRMVLERIRSVVGDMPIELRMNGSDGIKAGGITPEDAVEQLLILEELVDMAHMSAGNRLSAATRPEQSNSHFFAQGHNITATALAKQRGVKIPVGVVGGLNRPELIEQFLEEGKADYVLMARQAHVEPQWVNKLKENRREDIRPCLRCLYCTDIGRRSAFTDKVTFSDDATYDIYCAINPLFGQGKEKLKIPLPKTSKTVAVIGGGIAGMEAALTAAQRGHKVVLYEKSNRLGGQLLFSEHLWFKQEIMDYLKYMETQLQKAGVYILMNTTATPELVEASNPDSVIVAVGAEQVVPPIPGIENDNVIMGFDLFTKKELLGKKLVIIGGGMVGCEFAIQLGDDGYDVTVIEMSERIANNAQLTQRMDLIDNMERTNVSMLVSTRCVEIAKNGLWVMNSEQNRFFIEADNVIICAGTKPLIAERDKFIYTAYEVVPVGDCVKASSICNAVHSGYDAAATLL